MSRGGSVIIWTVVDVKEAADVKGPNGQQMPTSGGVRMEAHALVQYQVGGFLDAYLLAEESRIEVVEAMPTVEAIVGGGKA